MAATPELETPAREEERSEDELLSDLDELLGDYVGRPGTLIPALQCAQGLMGYLPTSALHLIALRLGIPMSQVAGVVGFYSFFSRNPRGHHQVRVCLGTACYVRGAKEVLTGLKRELGVDIGQTTRDRCFSLEVGRCFGACGLAPVVMVDDEAHQRVRPQNLKNLLEVYRRTREEPHGGISHA